MSSDIQFIQTAKGAKALVIDYFRFIKIRSGKESRVYWRCSQYKSATCPAKATTDGENLISTSGEHSHTPDVAKVFVDAAINVMKEKVISETAPIPKIYDSVIEHVAQQGCDINEFSSCVLPSRQKDARTYDQTFLLIKQIASERGLEFNPSEPMSDFESGLICSMKRSFPSSKHKGCYYHFSQCVWRHVQSCGLQRAYTSTDTNFRDSVRKVLALPFLPVLCVRTSWEEVKSELQQFSYPRIAEFCEYISTTWVDRNAKFPVILWNHNKTESHRTNNHVEGWHSKLNRVVGKAHPNIYELVDIFKREETLTKVKIIQLANGAAPVPRKRKYVNVDEKLKRLKMMMSEGVLNTTDFLDQAKYLCSI